VVFAIVSTLTTPYQHLGHRDASTTPTDWIALVVSEPNVQNTFFPMMNQKQTSLLKTFQME
jgi:hypothetical protein